MKKIELSYLLFFFLINIIFATHSDIYLNNEHYGYWYFNKILTTDFSFPNLSRSPFYIAYISLFNWLQFPYNMILEAIFTNTILCLSLYLLFKDKLNFKLIFLIIFFSLGFIYNQVPYPQGIAFALANFSVYFKRNNKSFFLVYLFLICAIYFRNTYILVFFTFIFFDLINFLFFQDKDRKKKLLNIFVILVLFFFTLEFINNNSSSSRFNNGYFNSLKWSPTKSNSNIDIAFLLNFNYLYIEKNSQNLKEKQKDYYFTNEELFNGAQNIKDAFISNPKFFIWGTLKNSLHIPAIIFNKYYLRNILPDCKKGHSCLSNYLFISIASIIFIYFMYCYFLRKYFLNIKLKKILTDHYLIYGVSNALLIFVTIFAMPKIRYMLPFIFFIFPMIIILFNFLEKKFSNQILINITIFFFIISFSFFSYNLSLLKNFYLTMNNEKFYRLFEKYKDDMVVLGNEIKICDSILVDSPTLVLAFTNYNEEKIRTFSEIPPYGNYKPNNELFMSEDMKVQCVLYNDSLASSMGSNRGVGPNYELRRINYLLPFLNFNKKNLHKKLKLNYLGELLIYKIF